MVGINLAVLWKRLAASFAAAGHGHALTGAEITGALPVAKGGTGAGDAAGARGNIGAAAAKHGHAQEDVAGLVAALDGKVVKSIELKPGTDLNTVTQSGFYRINIEHKNLPSGAEYGQLIVSRGADTIAQIVIGFSNSKIFCRIGNPAEVGGPGSWTEWRRVYQEGDEVMRFVKQVVIDLTTEGWMYDLGGDAYYQYFHIEGIDLSMEVISTLWIETLAYPVSPPWCPVTGVAISGENTIIIWCAEVPAKNAKVITRFYKAV